MDKIPDTLGTDTTGTGISGIPGTKIEEILKPIITPPSTGSIKNTG